MGKSDYNSFVASISNIFKNSNVTLDVNDAMHRKVVKLENVHGNLKIT